MIRRVTGSKNGDQMPTFLYLRTGPGPEDPPFYEHTIVRQWILE